MIRDRKIKNEVVLLASDHAGFKLKEEIKKFLIKKREKVLDLGTKNTNSVDYPDYAHLLSKKITNNIKYHNAFNGGEENRVHLVACLTDYKFH